MGLDDDHPLADTGCRLHHGQRIGQVVEDPQQQHQIELANGLRGDVLQIDVEVFDLGAERSSRQLERPLGSPAHRAPRPVPASIPGRRPRLVTRRGARPQRRTSRPCAEVEDRPAFEPIRHPNLRKLGLTLVLAGGDEPRRKLDAMKPPERRHLVPETGIHPMHRRHNTQTPDGAGGHREVAMRTASRSDRGRLREPERVRRRADRRDVAEVIEGERPVRTVALAVVADVDAPPRRVPPVAV